MVSRPEMYPKEADDCISMDTILSFEAIVNFQDYSRDMSLRGGSSKESHSGRRCFKNHIPTGTAKAEPKVQNMCVSPLYPYSPSSFRSSGVRIDKGTKSTESRCEDQPS